MENLRCEPGKQERPRLIQVWQDLGKYSFQRVLWPLGEVCQSAVSRIGDLVGWSPREGGRGAFE